jgi:heme exporter protein A
MLELDIETAGEAEDKQRSESSQLLELVGLSCARGDRILFSNASLSLSSGEGLYVSGQNGAGKTSLLRLICGLAAPEKGDVLWNGQSIHRMREEFAKHLLFLGHAAALKDELNAVENLVLSSELSGRHVSKKQAVEALGRFGLKGREHLPSRVLSAGQRRRANLARLFLPAPPLWVLDEPFTALDTKAVQQVSSILSEHLKASGIVVFTTHQPVELSGCLVREATIAAGAISLC